MSICVSSIPPTRAWGLFFLKMCQKKRHIFFSFLLSWTIYSKQFVGGPPAGERWGDDPSGTMGDLKFYSLFLKRIQRSSPFFPFTRTSGSDWRFAVALGHGNGVEDPARGQGMQMAVRLGGTKHGNPCVLFLTLVPHLMSLYMPVCMLCVPVCPHARGAL
jgi:hypothetical protein